MSLTTLFSANTGPNFQTFPPAPEVARFETPTMQHLQALATTAAVEGLSDLGYYQGPLAHNTLEGAPSAQDEPPPLPKREPDPDREKVPTGPAGPPPDPAPGRGKPSPLRKPAKGS